jgi:glutaconate CoA-transferase subunit A
MSEKIISLQEAVRKIPDSTHIALGGFTTQRHPMAFVYEMIRQKKRDLYFYGHSPGGDLDLLIGAQCVKRVELAYEADEAFGTIGPRFRKAIENHEIEWEDYSNFGMVLRFTAGSMGVPFLPTKTMFGSDMLIREGIPKNIRAQNGRIASKKFHVMDCPFTKEKILLLPAINVDFCILHVQKAGSDGTVRIYGQTFADIQEALCARKVMVTCEEIVEPEELRANPESNQIPFFRVDYIVHVPYGAHPYSCFRYYDYDPEQINLYHKKAATDEGLKEYLDEFVYGVKDFQEYLERVGGKKKLRKLAADPELGYVADLKRR